MKKKKKRIKVRLWLLPLIYLPLSFLILKTSLPNPSFFGKFLTFMWALLYLPALSFELLGFFQGDILLAGSRATNKKVFFQIPTVARKDTLGALFRTIKSILREAPKFLKNWQIDIVTEENAQALKELKEIVKKEKRINLIIVPKSYHTKNNTKYKARANQYALEKREIKDPKNSYIYHLDDDSSVEESTIASIAEACEENVYLAQGILIFPNKLSTNFFTTLADSIRSGNDLGCFRFFTGYIKTPLIGLHGEHLLIRADIEKEIGWDFGENLVEDSAFAIEFGKRYPKKSHFLNSFVCCASPSTIGDLIRQRGRWFKGMRQLIKRAPLKSKIPIILRLFPWGIGIFGNVIFVYWLVFILNLLNYPYAFPSVINYPFMLLTTFCYSFTLYLYLTGLSLNLSQEKKLNRKILYFISLPFFLPILSFLEAIGALYSFRIKEFIVIKKPK